MIPWVKVLTAKPGDLSLIPGDVNSGRKEPTHSCPLIATRTLWHVCTHIWTHACTYVYTYIK